TLTRGVAPASGGAVIAATLLFPPGMYQIGAPLNFTGFSDAHGLSGGNNGFNVTVSGYGAQIFGSNTFPTSDAMIDALGSRMIRWEGLTILGGDSSPPKIGMLIGRDYIDNYSGGDTETFIDITFYGWFSFCCFYNLAGEQNVYYN